MFAFAVYDRNEKKIFLARDRLGIKPLYYYHEGDRFLFASEIKALLEYGGIERCVNLDALNRAMALRYVPGDETLIDGVRRLSPGHTLSYDLEGNTVSVKKYWDVGENIVDESTEVLSRRLGRLIKDSVNLRLMGDVPLGVFLSGGVDSTTIVGAMREMNPDGEIKTFSVGFEHGEDVSELDIARQMADHYNTDHKELMIGANVIGELPKMIWHADEPVSDPAFIPNYILSQEAKKKVTIILTGDGSDELFAGYSHHRFLSAAYGMKWLPRSVRGCSIPSILKRLPKAFLDSIYQYSSATGPKMFERIEKMLKAIPDDRAGAYLALSSVFDEEERRELLSDTVRESVGDLGLAPEYNKKYFCDGKSFLNQILTFDTKVLLPDNYLMKPDKMGMAHSVEGRVPFLDHRIVEFAFTIPPRLKLSGQRGKYILKKAVSQYVPKEIVHRRKQTFHVPIDSWIEGDLKDVIASALDEGELKRQGLFDPAYVQKILGNYGSSKLYYGRQLFKLLSFQIWYKLFIEGVKPEKIKIL